MIRKRSTSGMARDSILDHGFHSHSYHRHFEDYVERVRTDCSGTKKIIRTYIGNYYRNNLTKRQALGVKAGYAALYVLTVILFLKAGAAPVISNTKWYVALPEVLNLLVLLWLLKTMIYYATARKELTIGEYRNTSRSLLRTTLAAAISFGATLAGLLLSARTVPGGWNTKDIWVCAAEILICGICMLAVFMIEKRIKYKKQSKDVEVHEDDSYM